MKLALCLSSALCVLGQCVTVQHGVGAQAGDGVTFPKVGDTVTMHYVGTLTSGKKFDSSRDRGKPFSTKIGMGEVIQGWDQGVPQLSLGESAVLRISSACGYGAAGSPPDIPGGADLVFAVELLAINGRSAASGAAPWATTPSISQIVQQRPLPTCRPTSCGMGLTGSSESMTPVCSCHASCLNQGASLPCCQSFREVCQQTTQAKPVAQAFPSFQGTQLPSTLPSAPLQATAFQGTTLGTSFQGSSLQSTGLQGGFFRPMQGTTLQSTALQGTVQATLPLPSMSLPMSQPMPQAPALPQTPATLFPPASNLPECIPSQCGKAIGFGGGRPLCMCNPMCEMMKGTTGVLPCCPKLQEVCLDPWRSPSPAPPAFQSPATLPALSFAPPQTPSQTWPQFAPAQPAAAASGLQLGAQTRAVTQPSLPLQGSVGGGLTMSASVMGGPRW